jgi:hypothetical protein
MYLFTRAGTFRPGAVRSATAFVGAVTEKVRQETGEDVHAYLATMSPEVGTCAWAVFVESLDELEAIDDKLAVSEDYLDPSSRPASSGPGRSRTPSARSCTARPMPRGRSPAT